MNPHRYAGLPFAEQSRLLEEIIRGDALVWQALELARQLDLPDWMIVSGVIYNTVWNHLTAKPSGFGIKDIDLFFCDGADLSWEAENAVIQQGERLFATHPLPVEIRNQARVHLWYPDRFGRECPVYETSAASLNYFASKTHAVGIHLAMNGELSVSAPFGLDDMFSLRITPNHALDNEATHGEKGLRARSNWPEVTVVPW